MSVGDDRRKIVPHWPIPKKLTELRVFVCLLHLCRRFIKNFSHLAAPLANLTRKGSGIHQWDDNWNRAFAELKHALFNAPIMQPPNLDIPFRCHIDCSALAVGYTLTQLDQDRTDRAVKFFSKRFSTAEENYSADDRELLELLYFLKWFRCYLEGTEFEVIADNAVLKYFFSETELSRREAQWLEFLSQFCTTLLIFEKERLHVLGDVLSRAPHASFWKI